MPDYFTLAELRALPVVSDTVKYPNDRVEDAAAHIVSVIEREVETAFITRIIVDEVHDGGRPILSLHKSYTQSLLSVLEDGVDVTSAATLRLGILRKKDGTCWASGYDNIVVTYEHGYTSAPPADVKEMALKGTRAHLMATAANSSINDRQTSMNTGDSTINFVVAGQERPTGYPEVDAMILGYKDRLHVAKVY